MINPSATNGPELIEHDLEIVKDNPTGENITRLRMKARAWWNAGLLNEEEYESVIQRIPSGPNSRFSPE